MTNYGVIESAEAVLERGIPQHCDYKAWQAYVMAEAIREIAETLDVVEEEKKRDGLVPEKLGDKGALEVIDLALKGRSFTDDERGEEPLDEGRDSKDGAEECLDLPAVMEARKKIKERAHQELMRGRVEAGAAFGEAFELLSEVLGIPDEEEE